MEPGREQQFTEKKLLVGEDIAPEVIGLKHLTPDLAQKLTLISAHQHTGSLGGARVVYRDLATQPAGIDKATGQVLLEDYAVPAMKLKIGLQSWSHDIVFSSADVDTVAWAEGTITMADGTTTYSIVGGNTPNMSARTYIYLDIAVSTTVLQTTNTAGAAVGDGKILIAVAENETGEGAVEATFQVFGGTGGLAISANEITANEVITNSAQIREAIIANAHITDLSADKLNAGTLLLTSGGVNLLVQSGELTLNPGADIALESSATDAAVFRLRDTVTPTQWIAFSLSQTTKVAGIVPAGGYLNTTIFSIGDSVGGFDTINLQVDNRVIIQDEAGGGIASFYADSEILFHKDITMHQRTIMFNSAKTVGIGFDPAGLLLYTPVSTYVTMRFGSASNLIRFIHDGSNSLISTVTGDLVIAPAGSDVQINNNLTALGNLVAGGDVAAVDDLYAYGNSVFFTSGGDDYIHYIDAANTFDFVADGTVANAMIHVGTLNISTAINMQTHNITNTMGVYGVGGSLRLEYSGHVVIANHLDPLFSASYNLGGATLWWLYVNCHDVTYHSKKTALFIPDGKLKMRDGKLRSCLEVIKELKRKPKGKSSQGLPALDYKTLPVAAFVPAADHEGNLYPRDNEKDEPLPFTDAESGDYREPSDGGSLLGLLSVIIGAIKELDVKIEAK